MGYKLYGWGMLQKLPGNDIESIKDSSQNHEDFIKNYNEESDEGYFLEDDDQWLEKLHELHDDLRFFQKEWRLKKSKNLQLI